MREHTIFQAPHAIDVTATETVPTPTSWRAALPGVDQVDVLRLVTGAAPGMPGWCTSSGELHGPEIEGMCGGVNDKQPTHAGIWRQGNLLHFGFEPSPSQYNATGKKLLLNCIAYISRFCTDRPIVREKTFVDPTGSGMPSWRLDWLLTADTVDAARLAQAFAAPWQEQLMALDREAARAFVRQRLGALCADGNRFSFDANALALGVDVQKDGVLQQLAGRLNGDQADQAEALLRRLLPDGPAVGTTPNNWRNWLQARGDALCFDPHSHVWRLDRLAQWRGVPSAALRGPQRADGDAVRDPAAVALAEKVATCHGGARSFDDLTSFACALGSVHYLWDRRHGVFRMENHGTIPAGNFATPWKVAIFDTAADADILKGGGPEPRPFVSARGSYRELVERLFLPLLLLEPGTALQLLTEDDEGHAQLQVRLGGRGMNPRKLFVLHVDKATGELRSLDAQPLDGARVSSWRVLACETVGPLRLPTHLRQQGRRATDLDYSGSAWNPAVPAAAATASEWLIGDR